MVLVMLVVEVLAVVKHIIMGAFFSDFNDWPIIMIILTLNMLKGRRTGAE